jgi:23S rRNA (uracil1939-C5)-methyltransferase
MTVLTLDLHALDLSSDAIDTHGGRIIRVPLGIPGEKVRVEVAGGEKRNPRAKLLEILSPAPERVTPPCKHFGVCGGCHWQHISYEGQSRFKRDNLYTQLQRIGRQAQPTVLPVMGLADPWAYRNHVQLGFDPMGVLGYKALRSHDIVPIEECWIIHPFLDELWAALEIEPQGIARVSLRAGANTGEQLILLEGSEELPPEIEVDLPVSLVYEQLDGGLVVLAGNDHYHERLKETLFRVSAPSFFQVNTPQAERLVELVHGYLEPRPDDTVLDAYCGVGTFAVSLAPHVAQVLGIEESPWAIEDAVVNGAGLENMELIEGVVEEVLPEIEDTFSAAILDPPRAGCALAVLQALARKRPRCIVYVSCDPATLARDVQRLSGLGYALVEAQPVDMFPQTFHIETVALLHRVDK